MARKSFYTRDKQEVKAITVQLEEGLKELFAKEKYKSYLSMMSKMHNYSANNIQLITMQCPDATLRGRIKEGNYDFILKNGTKTLIKRRLFEKYLESVDAI